MFDADTLMEIYTYLVELRTIKRKKFDYEVSIGVSPSDSFELSRMDALLSSFSEFFKEV